MQEKLANINKPMVGYCGISLVLKWQSMQLRARGVTQVLVTEVATEMAKITRWGRTQYSLGPGSWLLYAKGTATNAELFLVIVGPVLEDKSRNELH